MKAVFLLKTSLFNSNGQSSRLAGEFVARAYPEAQVIERDLARDPVPHLDGDRFSAFVTPREERTAEQQAIVAFSDALIAEKGPQGLLSGRKAIIFATRGGLYAGTAADTQSAYLRQLLEFVGIADIEFVYAEGLAISEPARNAGLAAAKERMETLLQ